MRGPFRPRSSRRCIRRRPKDDRGLRSETAGLANDDGDDAGGAARHERGGGELHAARRYTASLKRPTTLSRRSAVPASSWARRGDLLRRGAGLLRWRPRPARPRPRTARRPRRPRRCRSRRGCASALIWCTAVAMSLTRPVTSATATPMASNASRVCSTVATPSAVRRPPSATTPTTFCGLGLDLADQRGDLARGALGLLGQLADLLGDDGEAAALLAGAGGLDRGVEREQVGLLGDAGDRVDDAADLARTWRPGPPSRCRPGRWSRSTWRIASVAWAAARTPSSATPRACSAASAVAVAVSALALAARAASWTASRVDSTMRTWRSAPWATSVTAEAISPTARPASSEVDAICCEAEATVPAPLGDLGRARSLSCARIAL